VQRVTRQGTVLRPLPSRGDVEAEFGAPRGIWADDDGVLVADTLRGVLQQFRGDGTFLRELACASPGKIARPTAVLRQGYGRCLFVDRGDEPGVRALGADGALQPVHGDVAAHCREVLGLAADRAGRVHVLDHLGERVVRFSADLQFEEVVIDLAELLDDPPHHSPSE
jgi:hypothetical protein